MGMKDPMNRFIPQHYQRKRFKTGKNCKIDISLDILRLKMLIPSIHLNPCEESAEVDVLCWNGL